MPKSSRSALLRDHAVIDRLAGRLGILIERKAEPAELSVTLRMLVETVHDHLEEEDAMIYAIAMRDEGRMSAEQVAGTRSAFERLKLDWQDYLALWTPEQIAEDRGGFEAASRAMLPRLRDRVRLETELLCLMDEASRKRPDAG